MGIAAARSTIHFPAITIIASCHRQAAACMTRHHAKFALYVASWLAPVAGWEVHAQPGHVLNCACSFEDINPSHV
jgi:flagellar biosynthesis/type III secretory pathway ATPase